MSNLHNIESVLWDDWHVVAELAGLEHTGRLNTMLLGVPLTVSMDAEDLIAHLSGGLAPQDRAAFRRAAENAMATSPDCSGEGAAYRVIARLWRNYFHPPADTTDNSWERHKGHSSKMIAGPALGRTTECPRKPRIVR